MVFWKDCLGLLEFWKAVKWLGLEIRRVWVPREMTRKYMAKTLEAFVRDELFKSWGVQAVACWTWVKAWPLGPAFGNKRFFTVVVGKHFTFLLIVV